MVFAIINLIKNVLHIEKKASVCKALVKQKTANNLYHLKRDYKNNLSDN